MNTLEELKQRVIKEKNGRTGKSVKPYSSELKRDVVDYVNKTGVPMAKVEKELGIADNSLCYWRKQVNGAIESRTVSFGKSGIRYALSTKIQAAEQVIHFSKSITSVAKAMNISTMTISKWVQDYQDGLYALENVTQVSRKKFKTSEVLIQEFEDMKQTIEDKKKEIKEALEREYQEKLAKLTA